MYIVNEYISYTYIYKCTCMLSTIIRSASEIYILDTCNYT